MKARPGRTPRQFILLMTDQQGANVVGCYGRPEAETPSLDRLAAQGVRFDAAHTTCPACSPARSAIFTGLFPHANGAWGLELPLGENVRTVGRRLRDGGVPAVYIGRWHLSPTDYFGDGRCPDGWDPAWWYDGRNYLEELPDDARRFSRRPHPPAEMRAAGFDAGMTYGRRVADRAIRFLREREGEDFLLVVSCDEPHAPCLAPAEFGERFASFEYDPGPAVDDPLEGKPDTHRLWAAQCDRDRSPLFSTRTRRCTWTDYFACNSFIDSELGRVIEAADRHAPGALVLETSDHGDELWAHRLIGKGPAMYEGSTRVPLIVRWPGAAPAGTVCRAPVSQADLTPTILDFFGLPRPPVLQGTSLLPALRDPAGAPARTIFMEYNRLGLSDMMGGFKPIRCAFDGRHKLVVNLLSTDELYDLGDDPAELRNRIDDPALAGVRARLHGELLEWMFQSLDPFRAPEWEYRPWNRPERLAWHGRDIGRPDDGYARPVLSYGTGMEAKTEPSGP